MSIVSQLSKLLSHEMAFTYAWPHLLGANPDSVVDTNSAAGWSEKEEDGELRRTFCSTGGSHAHSPRTHLLPYRMVTYYYHGRCD